MSKRRQDNVSVDEDKYVSLSIAGAGVPSVGNSERWLVNCPRGPFPGDGGSSVIAVVVGYYHVDVDSRRQVRGSGLDRVQGGG